ncbi:MAG: Fe-S cluster assembly protein SufB [Candidatus Gracilibacteria bacterium]
MATKQQKEITQQLADYRYGFHTEEKYEFKSEKGLTEEIVRMISAHKKEPEWMLDFRLKAYKIYREKPMPTWGSSYLNDINFEDIYYYIKPGGNKAKSWDDVPDEIKNTFEKLGVPEAERKFLSGVGAQFESETIYHSLQKHLEEKGVIFVDTDTAVQKYPDLVRKYFATVVPPRDNKLAALNSAVWSGGSFVYIPKGVHVELPLQAYFRINAENAGQFERTLIIAEEGSSVHYTEGCTAPIYTTNSLHSAVVEIVVHKDARVQYTTVQNWSRNVYNLVTKRAIAHENATMMWLDCNIGSKLTMKYPSIYLRGKGARGEILSIAMANKGQHQDAGGKIIHLAPDTSSVINAKSLSLRGGRTSYRGLLQVAPGAERSRSRVTCDALLLDTESSTDTYPTMQIDENNVAIAHEATVTKISEEQLFYLMSRGLSEQEASNMIVNGFLAPLIKEFPMEYALELNRLIALEMEGSVG